MLAPAEKIVVSAEDRKYNFSALLVAQVYREVEKTFGSTAVIGGRAVNIHCNLDYRRTNDIDFLVGGEITPERRSRFLKYGWTPAPNAKADGGREHFEKVVSYGGETHLVMIDINTTDGPRSLISLPASMDRSFILESSIEAAVIRGQYSESIRVASVPMLVAMKVATAAYMSENGTERQKRDDAITHLEDLYMLILVKYGSLNAFMEREFAGLEAVLAGWQYRVPLKDALRNAYEMGRICTRGGAAWTLKEKVRVDSATRMLRDSSDDWLAEMEEKRMQAMFMPKAMSQPRGKGRTAAYSEDLLRKFDEMYHVFQRNLGNLDEEVNVLNCWTGMHKKAIRSELGEIFNIARGREASRVKAAKSHIE